MAFFGAAFLVPLACALIVSDGHAMDFVSAGLGTVVLGSVIALATRRYRRELKPRDGFLLVTLAWALASASAAVPLILGVPGLSLTDAYFEAMSGLTTTGSTVLTGLDALAPSLNLWRHVLHWLGGLGIIVLAVAVLPLLGVGGMQLFRAESPGPVKDEKLTPRIAGTAKALWLAYLLLTVGGILALRIVGMSWLDAICHAFSAVSLGGFSTHDSSVGFFDSPAIEAVLITLMTLASLNFARHYMALRRRSLRVYLEDSETKAVLAALAFSILIVAGLLIVHDVYESPAQALRHSTFNVVSVITTTGFVSQDFEKWPIFAPIWMLVLSGVVCSTGSTGGGIKMFRTLVLSRHATREMKRLVHPSAVIPLRIGDRVVPDRIGQSVLAFVFLYFQVITLLTFFLLLTGMDFMPALSSIIASVNNMGPGLGPTGPAGNYQGLTDVQTWVCTLAMLLGRLEVFSVVVLLTAMFWRD